MTKLGKAAATAVAVTCLSGCFFLNNPFGSTVTEQRDYKMDISYANSVLQVSTLERAASDDSVNLNGNREVAGLAAIMSGDLEFNGMKAETTDDKTAETTETAKTTETVKTAETAEEEKIILTANVENCLNIRKKPDEKSDVVGKLFRGCNAEVTGEKGNWYKISSGKVKGWVSKDYVLTGDKAGKLLKKVNPSVATVTAKSLNLRAKASTDSDVVSVLKKNTSYMVLSKGKEWVKVRYTTNLEGYVSAEYVKIKKGPGKAVSLKTLESYVKLAEEKEAEREAKREAERLAAEEAEREAAAEKNSVSEKSSRSSSRRSSSKRSATSAGTDDVTLLAALCQYEAGTNYENCLAVANVVLNRVHSSSYPGTIRGVIYQRGQFGTVTSGALNGILANGPSSTCVKAARAALAGNNNIGSRVQFRAVWATDPSAHSNSVVIGDNCFF